MTIVADLVAKLSAETAGFQKGLGDASKSTRDFEKTISQSTAGVQGSFGKTQASATNFSSTVGDQLGKLGRKSFEFASGVALAMAGAVSAFVVPTLFKGWDRMVSIQDSTVALTVALGDSTKAAKLLDDVLEVVRGTPFNFDQFAAAAQQMVGMGVSAEKIPRYLLAIGEASASQGKRAGEFASRLSTVFGQISAANRIMGDDIQSFSLVGVNALAILGNSFGVTSNDMRDMISKGTIPAAKALDILTEGILNGSDGLNGLTVAFTGTMAGLRKTISGALGGISASMARLGASFLTPLMPAITTVFNAFTKGVNALAPHAEKLGQLIANSAAFKKLISFFENVSGNLPGIIEGFGEFKAVLGPLLGLIVALASTRLAESFGPLSGLFPEISPVLGLLLGVVATSKPLQEAFKSIMEALKPLLEIMGGAFKTVVEQIATALGETLVPAIIDMMPAIVELAEAFLPLLPVLADLAISLIPPLVDVLALLIEGGILALTAALIPAIDWLAGVTVEFVDMLVEADLLEPLIVAIVAGFALFKTVDFVAGAVEAITLAFEALNIAMLANPVGLIVAGLVLLGLYIYILWTNWDTIWTWMMEHKAFALIGLVLLGPLGAIFVLVGAVKYLWDNWDTIWNWIQEKALEVWAKIEPTWSAISDYVTGTLVPIILDLRDKFVAAWEWIASKAVDAWNNWIKPAFYAISDFVTGTLVPAIIDLRDKFFMAWEWIAKVANNAWKNFIEPVFNAIKSFIMNLLLPYLKILWTVWSTVFKAVAKVVMWAWSNVIGPAFGLIVGAIVGTVIPMFNLLVGFFTNVLIPYLKILWTVWSTVFKAIATVVGWLWTNIVYPVFSAVYGFITETLIPAFKGFWGAVAAVFKGIADAIGWAWNNVIKPIWGFIKAYIGLMMDWFGFLWGVVKTVWEAISGAIGSAWGVVSGIIGSFIGAVINLYNTVKEKIEGVAGFFWGLVTTIGGIGKTIADAIFDAFKAAWNLLADIVNNIIPDSIGIGIGPELNLPDNPLPKFHSGGIVPGLAGMEVPAMLQAGELVISRQQLASIQRGTVPSSGGRGGDINVYVNQPNASAYDIGREIYWKVKVAG